MLIISSNEGSGNQNIFENSSYPDRMAKVNKTTRENAGYFVGKGEAL